MPSQLVNNLGELLGYGVGLAGFVTAVLTLLAAKKKREESAAALATAHQKFAEALIARDAASIKLEEADQNFRRAEIDLNRAQAEQQTALARLQDTRLQLERTQLALAEAKNQISIGQARHLFQQADCFGSDICVELVCFPLYKTCQDALVGIDRLKANIQFLHARGQIGPIRWVQQALNHLVGRVYTLEPPAEQDRVYAAIIECYAKLVPVIKIQAVPQRRSTTVYIGCAAKEPSGERRHASCCH